MMEQPPTAKRSVSQGSLRNNCRTQSMERYRRSSGRHAMRNGNKSVTFLQSPGPLESMLKTTTETGDIGVFSISYTPVPIPPTSHGVSRPRPSLDGSIPARPCLRGIQEPRLQDDRRRLPSYRDTASEIVSMYGSDSHPSSSNSTLSPPDEHDRRSYSMVTSGSRHLPCQSSNHILQRPRSPFPYPTRLKRPGVRPTSPALTENGSVDYSRMVGIDRVSSRTVHGSYRAIYPQSYRRRPPVSMRSDSAPPAHCLPQSSTSLSFSGNQNRQGPKRQMVLPLAGEYSNQLDMTSQDQRVRSTSFTSIVELYQRPAPTRPPSQQLRCEGSFYYDYTEGFDDCMAPILPIRSPASPFAPIPRRASSLIKPLVLRDESEARLDAVVDISVKDFSEASTRDRCSQDTSIRAEGEKAYACITQAVGIVQPDTHFLIPSLDRERVQDQETAAYESNIQDPTCSVFEIFPTQNPQVVPATLTGSGAQPCRHSYHLSESAVFAAVAQAGPSANNGPDSTSIENSGATLTSTSCKAPGIIEVAMPRGDRSKGPTTPRRFSSQGGLANLLRSSRHTSLSPALTDLAGTVSSAGKMSRTSFDKKEEPGATTTTPQADNPRHNSVEGNKKGGGPSFRRHRRNRAALRISTANLPTRVTETLNMQTRQESPSPRGHESTTVSCLKELPSLPNTDRLLTTPDHTSTQAEDQFLHSFSPFYLSSLSTPRTACKLPSTPETKSTEHVTPSSLSSSLKAHVKSNRSSKWSIDLESTRPCTAPATDEIKRYKCSKKTLKLRTGSKMASKFQMRRLSVSGHEVNEPRYAGAPALTEVPRREALGVNISDHNLPLKHVYRKRGRRFVLATERIPGASSPLAGRLGSAHIPLAHPVLASARPSISTDGGGSRVGSLESNIDARFPRLKKKMSHLQLRLTHSRFHLRDHALRDKACFAGKTEEMSTGGHGRAHRIDKPRGGETFGSVKSPYSPVPSSRLKKWVIDARRAMKAYVRRAHDQELDE